LPSSILRFAIQDAFFSILLGVGHWGLGLFTVATTGGRRRGGDATRPLQAGLAYSPKPKA
jgi:hypothetical protein